MRADFDWGFFWSRYRRDCSFRLALRLLVWQVYRRSYFCTNVAAVDCKSIVKQIPVRQGFRQNHVSISFKDMVLGFFRFRDRGRMALNLIAKSDTTTLPKIESAPDPTSSQLTNCFPTTLKPVFPANRRRACARIIQIRFRPRKSGICRTRQTGSTCVGRRLLSDVRTMTRFRLSTTGKLTVPCENSRQAVLNTTAVFPKLGDTVPLGALKHSRRTILWRWR